MGRQNFCNRKKHKQGLIEETRNKKIVVLDIEDNYKYMDEELIEIIKKSVEPYDVPIKDFIIAQEPEKKSFLNSIISPLSVILKYVN